jgi:hypothetical protein
LPIEEKKKIRKEKEKWLEEWLAKEEIEEKKRLAQEIREERA